MVDQINAGMEQQANGTDDGTADSPIKRAAKEAEEDANTPTFCGMYTHTCRCIRTVCVVCRRVLHPHGVWRASSRVVCARVVGWLVGCVLSMVLTCLKCVSHVVML